MTESSKTKRSWVFITILFICSIIFLIFSVVKYNKKVDTLTYEQEDTLVLEDQEAEKSSSGLDPIDLLEDQVEYLNVASQDQEFQSHFFPLLKAIYEKPSEKEALGDLNQLSELYGEYASDQIRYAAFDQVTGDSPYTQVSEPTLFIDSPIEIHEDGAYFLDYTAIIGTTIDLNGVPLTQNNIMSIRYNPATGLIDKLSVRVIDGKEISEYA